MDKFGYLIYSLVAAISISLANFFIGIEFDVPYAGLIAVLVFFFSLFTYTLDHYFDSLKIEDKSELHSRHLVKKEQYQIATKGFALTAVISVYFFVIRPMPLFHTINGFALAAISGLYFIAVFKFNLHLILKQLIGALVLTGIIASWPLGEESDYFFYAVYVSFVFLSVLSNLLFFGWIDKRYDMQLDHTQRKFYLSLTSLRIFFTAAAVFIFVMGAYLGKGQSWCFIPLAYTVISFLPLNTIQRPAMRITADLCMLLPLIKWFWV